MPKNRLPRGALQWGTLILTCLLLGGCIETYAFFFMEPGVAWGVPCLGDLFPPSPSPNKGNVEKK